MSRFVSMPAGWQDSDWFQPVSREPFDHRSAWYWMVEAAAFKDRSVDHGGKSHAILRGQIATSLPDMGQIWGWNIQKVARFMRAMSERRAIVMATGMRTTIITICFYNEYQRGEKSTVMATDERPMSGRHATVMDSRAVSEAVPGIPRYQEEDSASQNLVASPPNGHSNDHATALGEPLILTPSEDGPAEIANRMVEIWRENCAHFNNPRGLDKARVSKLNARWKDSFGRSEQQWREYCARVRDAPLLCGAKGEWNATIDWVLEPKNLTKVHEGNYDDKSRGDNAAGFGGGNGQAPFAGRGRPTGSASATAVLKLRALRDQGRPDY